VATRLTPRPHRWCDWLPAITAEISCGGQPHHVTLRRGKLVLHDHDVLAERSLSALGAHLPVCVEVLDAWRGMRGSDLLAGVLFSEGTLSPEELAFRRSRNEIERGRVRGRVKASLGGMQHPPEVRRRLQGQLDKMLLREKRLWDLSLVEAMPPALRRALALSIIVRAERHWHDEDYRRAHGADLESALTTLAAPLLERSARRWRRNVKAYASFVLEPRLIVPGEQPAIDAALDTDGASVLLSLSLSWFTDVWVRGIALVDDCFVLCRTGGSPDDTSLPVEAVRWERDGRNTSKSVQAPAIVTRGHHGDWALHWV